MSDWSWPGEAARVDDSRRMGNVLAQLRKDYNGSLRATPDDTLPNIDECYRMPHPKQRVNYYAD